MSGGCKCRYISVKRNLKIEANVVVTKCTVCCRAVVYYISFRGGGGSMCFNSQNTPLLGRVSVVTVAGVSEVVTDNVALQ